MSEFAEPKGVRPDDRADIDSLIPPPANPVGKVLGAIGVIVSTVLFTVFWDAGVVYPDPLGGGIAPLETTPMESLDPGVVGVVVQVPNNSRRDVRLTEVDVDIPNVDLVDVEVRFDERTSSEAALPPTRFSRWMYHPMDPQPEFWRVFADLPATVPDSWEYSVSLVVWVRPTDCEDSPPAAGTVTGRFDFGDGSFPPVSRSVPLVDGPVKALEPYVGMVWVEPFELLCGEAQ